MLIGYILSYNEANPNFRKVVFIPTLTEQAIIHLKSKDLIIILQEVSDLYPEISVIQNRGFETIDYSLPYIDGFLWEDWRANWKKDAWMKAKVDKLRERSKRRA